MTEYLKDIFKTPNLISLFRISLLIPIFFLLSDLEANRTVIIIIILVAFISDLTDGYVARKTNQITEIGKILDPLGDKIFVAVLVIKFYLTGEIDSFYFWVILLRDVIIFSGGLIIQKMINKILPSNLLGKIAVFSIGCYLLSILFGIAQTSIISSIFYYSSLILSVASVLGYALRAFETVRWYKKNEFSEKHKPK
ncbi:MAG: hypothetical protein CVV23_17595 [Ignavibacteriae bacterium HGW-Ignavibacteriae-2]|jgi:CDP-diacylglycerol--glycerol-3-phosphate 3-phosphatidyltransferase|nr:MAG: hypothetical protein CVV23_17595 [Ignavibacteriae bacterium HGW-Ignavibacteriae-2]